MKAFVLSLIFSFVLLSGNAQVFTRGKYIALDSSVHAGLVAYQVGQGYFQFRANAQAKVEKFKPEDVIAMVWGVDSFPVKENDFVRILIRKGPVLLYQKNDPGQRLGAKPAYGPAEAGESFFHLTYLVERKGTGEVLVVEKNDKKFAAQMSAFFSDMPELARRIEKKEFQSADIEMLVRQYNEMAAGK